MVTYDNEYTSYENSRFNNFVDHGYSGHISIAMAKINNLILGNGDFYLNSIGVEETTQDQYNRKRKE